MSESGSPVAGWYVDPQDAAMVRWWDGVEWSEHTQSRPSDHLSEPVAPVPATQPTRPSPAEPVVPAAVSPDSPVVPVPVAPVPPAAATPNRTPTQDAGWVPQAPVSGSQPDGTAQPVPQPGGAFAPPPQAPPVDQTSADEPQSGFAANDLPTVAPGSEVPVPPVPSINPPLAEYAQVGSTPISAPLTESGEPKSGKGKGKMIWIIILIIVLLIAVGAGAWFYLQSKNSTSAQSDRAEVAATSVGGQPSATTKPSGATPPSSASPSTEPAAVAAAAVPAVCSQAISSLTADGTAATVAAQLRSAATGGSVSDAAATLADIAVQSKPVMAGDAAQCQGAVTAGKAPAAYSSFLVTFQRSVTSGQATLTSVARNKGKVTAAQKQQLISNGNSLLAAQRVVAPDAPVVSAAPPAG